MEEELELVTQMGKKRRASISRYASVTGNVWYTMQLIVLIAISILGLASIECFRAVTSHNGYLVARVF